MQDWLLQITEHEPFLEFGKFLLGQIFFLLTLNKVSKHSIAATTTTTTTTTTFIIIIITTTIIWKGKGMLLVWCDRRSDGLTFGLWCLLHIGRYKGEADCEETKRRHDDRPGQEECKNSHTNKTKTLHVYTTHTIAELAERTTNNSGQRLWRVRCHNDGEMVYRLKGYIHKATYACMYVCDRLWQSGQRKYSFFLSYFLNNNNNNNNTQIQIMSMLDDDDDDDDDAWSHNCFNWVQQFCLFCCVCCFSQLTAQCVVSSPVCQCCMHIYAMHIMHYLTL